MLPFYFYYKYVKIQDKFVYKYSGRGLMYKQSLAEGLDIQEIIRIFMDDEEGRGNTINST